MTLAKVLCLAWLDYKVLKISFCLHVINIKIAYLVNV